jgi:hypothetical protein
MYALWRAQILAMFAVFVVAAVFMVAAIAAGSGPPVWFAAFWLAALVWNGYWFLFRVAYQLDLTEHEICWRTPLRSGSIALTDLVELRPHRFGSSIEVIQLASGTKVLVMVRKGFVDFMMEIQRLAPQVHARVGAFAKLGNRLPGPRGFRRRE